MTADGLPPTAYAEQAMLDRYDENLILGYVENELDDTERAAFEQLLAADDQLRATVEAMVSDRQMLRDVPAIEAPSNLMSDVTAALERQMLAAPTEKIDQPASPVVYRFPRWARWGGAMAAMFLLAAGITWQLDPFNWSKPAPSSTELAMGGPQNKPGGQDALTGDNPNALDANQHGEKLANNFEGAGSAKYRGNDADLNAFKQDKDIAGDAAVGKNLKGFGDAQLAGSDAAPTDKGSAALALAMESQRESFELDQLERGLLKQQGGQNQADRVAAGPAVATAQLQFQVQVASAQAVSTRDALLDWAQRNGATDGDDLRRQRMRGNAEPTVDGIGARAMAKGRATPNDDQAPVSPGAPTDPDASKGDVVEPRDAKTIEEQRPGNAKETPAAAPPKPEANLKANAVADPAATVPARPEIAPADPSPEPTPSEKAADSKNVERKMMARADGGARGAQLQKLLAEDDNAAVSVLVLLVPEDRLDALVTMLESKTGQSLVLVNEQGQTMLVSPQVANRRMQPATQSAAFAPKAGEKSDALSPQADERAKTKLALDPNAAFGNAPESLKDAAGGPEPDTVVEAKKGVHPAKPAPTTTSPKAATDPTATPSNGAVANRPSQGQADGTTSGPAGKSEAEDTVDNYADKEVATKSDPAKRAAVSRDRIDTDDEAKPRKVIVRIIIREEAAPAEK